MTSLAWQSADTQLGAGTGVCDAVARVWKLPSPWHDEHARVSILPSAWQREQVPLWMAVTSAAWHPDFAQAVVSDAE